MGGVAATAAAMTLMLPIAASTAHAATADVNVGELVKFSDHEGSTGGGEFGVMKGPNFNTDSFRTFCVQTSEFLDFSSYFKVGNISTSSVVLTPHTLEAGTAFLYTKFRDGTLADYNYSANTQAHIDSANALQLAIWALQGQSGGSQNAYYYYALDAVDLDSSLSNVLNVYGDTNLWNNGVTNFGIGGVRIANMIYSDANGTNGVNAQDQLVLVPTPTASYAGMGLLSGLACVGLLKKRRTTRNQLD